MVLSESGNLISVFEHVRIATQLEARKFTKMSTSSEEKAAANKLETMRKAVHDFLHEKNAFTSVFEIAEKYTKVDRMYIFLGRYL